MTSVPFRRARVQVRTSASAAVAQHEEVAVVAAAPRLVVEPGQSSIRQGRCHGDMRHGRLIQWLGRRM